MKSKLKKDWIEALEGGSYDKGKGFLRRYHCFCCLGVLVDISKEVIEEDPRFKVIDSEELMRIEPNTPFENKSYADMIPKSVLSKLGLTLAEAQHLAVINDRTGDFNEVIKTIREVIREE